MEEADAIALQERTEENSKIDDILRHIQNVQENCFIIARELIVLGESALGRRLIVNALSHDTSKFFGIEWDYLGESVGKAKLDIAVAEHGSKNAHHPEYWAGGIEEMPKVALAEMVADWKARSEEFGTDIRAWVDGGAMERFGYKKNGRVHKEILYFLDMLCDKPFKQRKSSH